MTSLQTHRVVLDPLPGHLKVDVSPVAISARVVIDDLIEAEAPTTISNIEAGPREVAISG